MDARGYSLFPLVCGLTSGRPQEGGGGGSKIVFVAHEVDRGRRKCFAHTPANAVELRGLRCGGKGKGRGKKGSYVRIFYPNTPLYSSSLQYHDGTSTSPITPVCATSAGREGNLSLQESRLPERHVPGGGVS